LSSPTGALVAGVQKEGPAAKAGIQRGDVIIKFNDATVHDEHELPELVARTPLGHKVPIELIRGGKRMTIDATIAELKDQQVASVDASQEPGSSWGLTVQDLTPDVAHQLGIQATKGVVIHNVKQDSPAGEAGLHPGDVILEVDHKKIDTADAFATQAKEAQRTKKPALLLVQRADATLYVVINPES
jgi:serine protease Do